MGNPGKARAMEVTAFKAIGLTAMPTENENSQWLAYCPLNILFSNLYHVTEELYKIQVSLSLFKIYTYVK